MCQSRKFVRFRCVTEQEMSQIYMFHRAHRAKFVTEQSDWLKLEAKTLVFVSSNIVSYTPPRGVWIPCIKIGYCVVPGLRGPLTCIKIGYR